MDSIRHPDWLNHIWAKSSRGENLDGESLSKHTYEVILRLLDLIKLRPWMPEKFNIPHLWTILFWGAFFHDWGKCASGFQQMLKGGPRWGHRHEVFSLFFFDWTAHNFPDEVSAAIASCIVSHHRDYQDIMELYPPDIPGVCSHFSCEIEKETLSGMHRWLTEVLPEWIDKLDLDRFGISYVQPLEAKVATARLPKCEESITKWLRVYSRLVRTTHQDKTAPIRISGMFFRGCTVESDHLASAHAPSLPQLRIDRNAILSKADLTRKQMHDHQIIASETQGSAILIAPTGTGKTEAALLWANRQ
ncbi:CRISPR-associated endonuclease Cas3'', partial [bacterium]|nr:CRISPR-associated endonuclease Cas3'' [bacterium]